MSNCKYCNGKGTMGIGNDYQDCIHCDGEGLESNFTLTVVFFALLAATVMACFGVFY